MSLQRHLILLVKAPRLGAVKTRLAGDVGWAAATGFYRASVARAIRRLAFDPRWRLTLAVTPDRSTGAGFWPAGPRRAAQGPGDLGARMARVLKALPPGPAVLIGGDIPEIRPRHIRRAFAALGDAEAVFGPATDGGYWLVGLKRRPWIPAPFADVRWSSEHALADSLANFAGRRVALIDELNDIDTGADLRRWRGRQLAARFSCSVKRSINSTKLHGRKR